MLWMASCRRFGGGAGTIDGTRPCEPSTSGREAYCAYCGEVLPPLPPRGGRPTPYCPADPERYGQWGAKVISCAMLDEQREIWVHLYGADQPMTPADVAVLDQRAAALVAALEPVRDEVQALRDRLAKDTAAALAAAQVAEQARDEAVGRARDAEAARVAAVTEAEHARDQAGADRAAARAAQDMAAAALQDRDEALAAQRAAEQARHQAQADRQHALDQTGAAANRITTLQDTLAAERATALDQLDQLRRRHEHEREQLRATLSDEHEKRLRARMAQFADQADAARRAADQQAAALHDQLTAAARAYADVLAPLHDELRGLRDELVARTQDVTVLRAERETLLATLREIRGADDAAGAADASGTTGPQASP